MSADRTPHLDSTLTVPNALTSLRILMAIAAGIMFATGSAEKQAVVMCVFATALDAFDGWYARTFSQCSKLGEHLDPLADKLLMAVVYGLIAIKMDSPAVWALIALIAFREAGMTLFRAYSLRRHQKFIPANSLGKAKMIVQSTIGVAIIAYAYLFNGGFVISPWLVFAPLLVILVLSYVSAVVYLRSWRWGRASNVAALDLDDRRGDGRDDRMVVGK